MSILQAIGNTSLVRLQKVVPASCAAVLVKLEWENPTGSMKDRMALSVIAKAEADGRLQRGDTVIEYTGGSTGASLALVCAVPAAAQDDPFVGGDYVEVTGVTVDDGHYLDYANFLAGFYKAQEQYAVSQG